MGFPLLVHFFVEPLLEDVVWDLIPCAFLCWALT